MGSIPTYDIGDKIRIGNHTGSNDDGEVRDAFRDAAAVATDPTTVTLRVRKLPSGTTKVYGWPSPGVDGTLTRESVGRFYTDYTAVVNDDGDWAWRLEGTSIVQTAEEGQFTVRPSAFF